MIAGRSLNLTRELEEAGRRFGEESREVGLASRRLDGYRGRAGEGERDGAVGGDEDVGGQDDVDARRRADARDERRDFGIGRRCLEALLERELDSLMREARGVEE